MAKNTAPFTASGQIIPAGAGTVVGIIVCSHTNGTLKLVDSPTSQAGRIMLDTFTFSAGSQVILFGQADKAGLDYGLGVNAVVGGTANIELIYQPTIN